MLDSQRVVGGRVSRHANELPLLISIPRRDSFVPSQQGYPSFFFFLSFSCLSWLIPSDHARIFIEKEKKVEKNNGVRQLNLLAVHPWLGKQKRLRKMMKMAGETCRKTMFCACLAQLNNSWLMILEKGWRKEWKWEKENYASLSLSLARHVSTPFLPGILDVVPFGFTS